MSDVIFQVEPPNNGTRYKMEIFRRVNDSKVETEAMQEIFLKEKELENLDEENFAKNTQLNFDIRNASELRYFLSSLFFIRAEASNLILLSFDNEDTLNCQNWTININYNFREADEVGVTKTAEYNNIVCEQRWKEQIGYDVEDEAPVRRKETYFINYVSLFCNLWTYYYIVGIIVNISKYNKLEKQKQGKMRWVEQSNNTEDFMRVSKAFEQKKRPDVKNVVGHFRHKFFGFSNVTLIISNSFLLCANLILMINAIGFELAQDSSLEKLFKIFLGFGCSISMVNVVTILAKLESFRVVD